MRWHSRARRSASASKNRALASVRAASSAVRRAAGLGGELAASTHPAAMASWRVAIRVSQCRHASMPSPVVALSTMRSTSGWTWSML